MPDRRLVLILYWLLWPSLAVAALPGTWVDYCEHYITEDGRVIDTGRGDISHSESQGYGLLLALRHEDRNRFETIRRWITDNLKVRRDGLLAWSWGPRPDGTWAVIDYNNATDGDLLVSWALVEAGKRWHRKDYRLQGNTLAGKLRELLAVRHQGKTVLLPGHFGFNHPGGIVLNPAYFVFPAFRALAGSDQRELWREFWTTVEQDALALLSQSVAGPLNLPPDWLLLGADGKVHIYKERSRNFGYEAIRVPLYLALAEMKAPLRSFSPYLQWIAQRGYLPATVDLVREQVSLNDAPAGFYAVMGRCAAVLEEKKLSRKLFKSAARKIRNEPQDYYSYTLYLLSQPEVSP